MFLVLFEVFGDAAVRTLLLRLKQQDCEARVFPWNALSCAKKDLPYPSSLFTPTPFSFSLLAFNIFYIQLYIYMSFALKLIPMMFGLSILAKKQKTKKKKNNKTKPFCFYCYCVRCSVILSFQRASRLGKIKKNKNETRGNLRKRAGPSKGELLFGERRTNWQE